MNKPETIEAAADAVDVATQAINNYGPNSTEAQSALQAARAAVTTAKQAGASDDDLHAARPH